MKQVLVGNGWVVEVGGGVWIARRDRLVEIGDGECRIDGEETLAGAGGLTDAKLALGWAGVA